MAMSNQIKMNRVVVTGMGVMAPNGIGYQEFFNNTLAGRSGISVLPWAKEYGFKSHIAGQIQDFDPLMLGLLQKELQHTDRQMQLALIASHEAMKMAGLEFYNILVSPKQINALHMGVCIATAIAGTKFMEEEFLKLTKKARGPLNPSKVNSILFNAATFNTTSMMIGKKYQCTGPVFTLTTGCSAGLDAIGASFDLIRSGQAKIMITGASEAPLTPVVMAAFDAIGALSSQYNHDPARASRPYEISRDGFVLGEGAGILILEEREHALARQAPILAEIKGYGSSCNAYHMTSLSPDGEDLASAINIALNDADMLPEDIDYINAHGSSTPQNDVNETNAIKKIFGDKAYQLSINSLKSLCGHALAAANAIEMVAAIGCLNEQKTFPTINQVQSDPLCDLNYTPNVFQKRSIQHAIKTASGFSGIHSAIVVSKAS